MRVYLTALGCKLNQAETTDMSRRIAVLGHQVVDEPADADWAIVNTCTVTHIAARKVRQLVRSLRRRAPALRIAATGCYAQISPEILASLPGVELVVPNTSKDTLVDMLLAHDSEQAFGQQSLSDDAPPKPDGHTRAFVKVQDGCDNRCAYCIVTVARGPARSVSADAVLADIQRRVGAGYREVVLTGINIGAYGRGSQDRASGAVGPSLADLVRRILEETAVERLRLSSIEPPDLTPELVALWPNERLCRHMHLSLQSGCDATLTAMRRQYTSRRFADRVAALRQAVPDVSLTTDVIVGFPGETVEHFEASLCFCREMRFARMHVFKFSNREGTLAATMPDQVPPQVIQSRSERMIALGNEMAAAYHAGMIGRTVRVLAETDATEDGRRVWQGLTDTYVRARFASPSELRNRYCDVRVTGTDAHGVQGELVSTESDGS